VRSSSLGEGASMESVACKRHIKREADDCADFLFQERVGWRVAARFVASDTITADYRP
jgi:hypothetical protein